MRKSEKNLEFLGPTVLGQTLTVTSDSHVKIYE